MLKYLKGKEGKLQTGRNLDDLDKGNDNRRSYSLYLSLMDLIWGQLDRFGDADRRLTGL